MKTPYGNLNVGDIFRRADGSAGFVKVVDVDTHASVEDAVVEDDNRNQYRIDWFKLMVVRYDKEK